MNVLELIASSIEVTDSGCWEWQGKRVPDGYGRVTIDGRNRYTHRLSYELHVGPIPKGLEIDHLCRNKPCCNPDHLEAVTLVENVMRGAGVGARNAAKTHCPQDHEYDEANTIRNSRGARVCRACVEARKRK